MRMEAYPGWAGRVHQVRWTPFESREAMSRNPCKNRWRSHLMPALLPRRMRGWLRDPGSLTERICARCEVFSVRILRQHVCPVLNDEAAVLGLRPGRVAWVREVLLLADWVPVVYARSVLPFETLRAGSRLFAKVGSRPLGAALFANPRVKRGELVNARLDQRDARYRAAARAAHPTRLPREVWGRRSTFCLRNRRLLVSEIFLPAILDLPV